MDFLTRREALGTLIRGGLAVALLDLAGGRTVLAERNPARWRCNSASCLIAVRTKSNHFPIEAGKLKGLSEKLITSHHQNNYGGAVKRLNQIQQQIGSLPKDAAPYQMGRSNGKLIATNSMILHEFYFGNLGGDGKPAGRLGPD